MQEKPSRKMRESVEKTNHIKNEWKEANKVAERIGCSFHITKMQYIIKHSHSRAHTLCDAENPLYLAHFHQPLMTRSHFSVYCSSQYIFYPLHCLSINELWFFLRFSSLATARLVFLSIFFFGYYIKFSTHYWVDPDFQPVIVTTELKFLTRL